MKKLKPKLNRKFTWYFWITGFIALAWIVIRSGTNPKRLAYPCQKASYPLASAWLVAIISLIGGTYIIKKILKWSTATIVILASSWMFFSYSSADRLNIKFGIAKSWTSDSPVSEIILIDSVPPTSGSLAAGNASVLDEYLSDPAVDSMVSIMEKSKSPFFKTVDLSNGIIGNSDIVLIKANFQWRHRLGTNTDRIKGVIWQILNHPEGFSGEILVVDNQESQIWPTEWLAGFNDYSNNSDDTDQSIVDVINTFKAKGYPVDFFVWDSLNNDVVSEYSEGDLDDGYIFDSATLVSYPKFTTPGGKYVSFSKGIWDNVLQSYDSDKLTIINFPVLKAHGMVGATIAMKNYIGVMNTTKHDEWFGGWVDDTFHPLYCFSEYALVAREIEIAWPDLNIVDATWVGTESNYNYTYGVEKVNKLLASTDPVAVSWYAAKYILTPVAVSPSRTNPDEGFGVTGNYSTVFGYWYNYIKDSTSFICTRDSAEISILTSVSDGNVLVSNINIDCAGSVDYLLIDSSLQFNASVFPKNANDTGIIWSVVNETGKATINQDGLLTADSVGRVNIRVDALDGSGVFSIYELDIIDSFIPVDSVAISDTVGSVIYIYEADTIQFEVEVSPVDATDKNVIWSVVEKGGGAIIDQTGLMISEEPGEVLIKVVSSENSAISDSINVIILELNEPMEPITMAVPQFLNFKENENEWSWFINQDYTKERVFNFKGEEIAF